MPRPSYTIVSTTVVALSIFGLVVESLRDQIPPGPKNRLQYEAGEFLAMGSRSEVDWRPFDKTSFAEARRTGKPVLLLIGLPHSKAARDAEEIVFKDREIVSFMNRYMVCMRIDAQADPRWVGAFLPLQRQTIPMFVGFQVWFLTPEGKLYENAGELGMTVPIKTDTFSEALINARERFRVLREGGPLAPVAGARQKQDLDLLTLASTPSAVNFRAFEQDIQRTGSLTYGGFPRFGRVPHFPNVFRYLLLAGRFADFKQIADAMLANPAVDWLDGGFYRSVSVSDRFQVEFDKAAFANAELMAVFAKAAAISGDPLYRRIAVETFDTLAGPFAKHGFVVGCRMGDEGAHGRSARNSFSPLRLREILSPKEREIARQHLGLRVEVNRGMSVWIRNPRESLEAPGVTDVLQKLREARTGEDQYAKLRQLDIHGYVVARLLETARILGDEERLRKADNLFSLVDWFRAADDVKHTLDTGIPDNPFLGDYLAYVDACLQHFLAFGRTDSFERGLQVLRRARFLFESEVAGAWKTALDSNEPLAPQDANPPEILDLVRESCTAQAIRLCGAYGRLLRNINAPEGAADEGRAWLQAAASAVDHVSPHSSGIGLQGAGYFCAAMHVLDDTHAIAVGSNSVSLSQQLAQKVPTRLVAPAIGPVRKDMQSLQPGIYLVRRGQRLGPLSVEDAAQRLSSVLETRP